MDIDGHGAVVMGGARGLGAATARHLAELGADVTILDIDGARAAEVAAQINGYSQHCDIREEQAVAAGITCAMARFGQAPRLVVNCAAIDIAARILGPEGKVSTPIFRHMLDVNVMGAYHLMTYAAQGMMDLPPLETGERGVIVQTALTEGAAEAAGQAGLAASLGGVAAMLRPAAQELAALGVRVMALESGAPEVFAARVVEIVRSPGLSGTVAPLVAPLPPAPGPAQGRAGA